MPSYPDLEGKRVVDGDLSADLRLYSRMHSTVAGIVVPGTLTAGEDTPPGTLTAGEDTPPGTLTAGGDTLPGTLTAGADR